MDKGRARLFIDEDVHAGLARVMREHDYDAINTLEAGRASQSMSDEDQLRYAVSQGRMLVVHNVADYYALDAKWRREGRAHCGIIVGVRKPLPDMARGIIDAIANYQDEVPGYIVWF